MSASSQRSLEEEQADLRLRDAAPEMLRALKRLMGAINAYHAILAGPSSNKEILNGIEYLELHMAKAAQVIAQAEGEQP